MSGKQEVPPTVAGGLGSTPTIHADNHDRPPSPAPPSPSTTRPRNSSDSALPSPVILKSDRRSAEVSTDEDEYQTIPPSPTLSTQSCSHFTTSTALWEHKPCEVTSPTSLLDPRDSPHSRRPVNVTTISIDSDAPADLDHPPYPTSSHVITSAGSSATHTLNTPTSARTSSSIDSNNSEERENEDARIGLDLTQDEPIDPTPFTLKPHYLASLVDSKNFKSLEAIGGIKGLLAGLGADPINGLGTDGKRSKSGDALAAVVTTSVSEEFTRGGAAYTGTVEDRQRVYGSNVLPARESKTLLRLMWLALKDKAMILLSVAAFVSLALGFYRDFGLRRELGKPRVDWVEGVAIIVAILLVVIIGSLDNWHKERQLCVLDEQREKRLVKVARTGIKRVIEVKELLVGDIAFLEPGEIVPCDGVLISGHNVKCDESVTTGESDIIEKVGYDECIALREQANRAGASSGAFNTAEVHTDCFVVSGSKVLEGYGKYVVIAVGEKSFNSRIMIAPREEPDPVSLQEKLRDLTELMKIGGGTGLAVCTALIIRSLMQPGTGEPEHGNGYLLLRITIASVISIFAAAPESLPLAIALALAFATKRTASGSILIRNFESSETMANISVVCTDKTATLTRNNISGSIGIHARFVRNLKENRSRTNGPDWKQDTARASVDLSIEQNDINTILSPQLKRLFNQSIAINSTAFEDTDPETNELTFVGSKTELALLQFSKELGWENAKETCGPDRIVQTIPFSNERKAMGVVVRLQSGRYRLFLKGASEVLIKKCTRHVMTSRNPDQSQDPDSEIETEAVDETSRDNALKTINIYAGQALKTIVLCYRDFESWPPTDSRFHSTGEVPFEDLSRDITLVAIIAVEDPLRPGVRDAVATCHRAGVAVKMCTEDNTLTARSIAAECGIYTAGGIIMEGPVFRTLDVRQRLEVVPRLQVLARSSPEDKRVLVETLRSLGEIVGITGDGVDDVPVLKAANVGFSMGISGTEVAKEASDIILVDDDFGSIVKAIMWGRCVNDSVCKFLQFHTSANVTTLIVTFLYLLAPAEELLNVPQLFWIHIIVATLTAASLTTDPASKSVLDKKPDIRGRRLFTADMMKMIIGQSGYQVIILLVIHFLGHRILGLGHTDEDKKVLSALMFNASFFGQIFNSLNCRRVDNKLNIFDGILRNRYFIAITLIEIAGQVLIVSVGGAAFQVTRIRGREWGISAALGFISIPLGALIRCIPTPPLERIFIKLRIMGADEILPTTRPDTTERNRIVNSVRDNSSLFSDPRSGRANTSSEEDPIALSTFAASSVGAGLTT